MILGQTRKRVATIVWPIDIWFFWWLMIDFFQSHCNNANIKKIYINGRLYGSVVDIDIVEISATVPFQTHLEGEGLRKGQTGWFLATLTIFTSVFFSVKPQWNLQMSRWRSSWTFFVDGFDVEAWAFGCILFEMPLGFRQWDGHSETASASGSLSSSSYEEFTLKILWNVLKSLT